MGNLFAFPILFILIILQTTLVNQVTLLNGSADLILLWLAAWGMQKQVTSAWVWTIIAMVSIAFITAIPWYVPIIGYAATTYMARTASRRIWQSPLLTMFLVTIAGSFLMYGLTYISLVFTGVDIPFKTGLVQVIIPSLLINLLLALPIFVIAKDAAQWLHPTQVTE